MRRQYSGPQTNSGGARHAYKKDRFVHHENEMHDILAARRFDHCNYYRGRRSTPRARRDIVSRHHHRSLYRNEEHRRHHHLGRVGTVLADGRLESGAVNIVPTVVFVFPHLDAGLALGNHLTIIIRLVWAKASVLAHIFPKIVKVSIESCSRHESDVQRKTPSSTTSERPIQGAPRFGRCVVAPQIDFLIPCRFGQGQHRTSGRFGGLVLGSLDDCMSSIRVARA